ncbi:MAG: hypothetical protein JXR97_08095, partial [Planctomycetes bacterium]|nr:hypothetical protein [Planctomycetota bacterium]
MRNLTSDALAARLSNIAQPALILDLDCGAAGAFRFSSRDLGAPINAAGRIASVSSIATSLEDSDGLQGRVKVRLLDVDGALKNLIETDGLWDAVAEMKQHFSPLGESDLIPLFSGIVSGEAEWREEDRSVLLTIENVRVIFKERPVGVTASRYAFSSLGKDEEGKTVPLAFGNPHRARALLAEVGAKTELARSVGVDDEVIIVKDASRFPSGATRIRIFLEEIEGSFSGNTFNVTQRGCSLFSGTTTRATGNMNQLYCEDLSATEDNAYIGRYIRATVAGREQTRRIVQSFADSKIIVIQYPFQGQGNLYAPVPGGTPFEITTLPAFHLCGESVSELLDGLTYIACDRPVDSILAVEGYGTVNPGVNEEGGGASGSTRGYVTIPPSYYEINTDDPDSFPALGHNVATVRMKLPPTSIPEAKLTTDEIFLTMRGIPDGAGGLLDNPAGVILYLLKERGGVPDEYIDEASFAEAAAARSDVHMSFAITEEMLVGKAVSDLAFQGRLALVWESGKIKCRALSNQLGDADASMGEGDIEFGSATLTMTPEDEIVTSLTARYTRRGEEEAVVVGDEEAE